MKFLNCIEQQGESIETYAKVLNDLASNCSYSDCYRDRLLRDAFVSGLLSSSILSSLLQEVDSKSFNECIEKAKMPEIVVNNAQDMKLNATAATYKVNKFSKNKDEKSNLSVPRNYVCIRCTAKNKYFARDCFARNL